MRIKNKRGLRALLHGHHNKDNYIEIYQDGTWLEVDPDNFTGVALVRLRLSMFNDYEGYYKTSLSNAVKAIFRLAELELNDRLKDMREENED